MHVPKSRSLIPLGIAAITAVLLALDVISLSNFLWVAGVMVATSIFVFIVAVASPKTEERKRPDDVSR